MKWIGQHIWSFISRFRDDVYLENISSGTIASGGNLGLDSNNKIVKQSDTGITDLHGAGVDGSANQLLTDDGDGTVTSEANLTWDGSDFKIESSESTKPNLEIKSTTDDGRGCLLNFITDKGSAGADGDLIGAIKFWSDNTAQEQTQFAQITGQVSEADDTDEAGKLMLSVAASSGSTSGLHTGLILEGEHATSGEVDATIANGAASTTTISGTLTMGSTATLNNTGEIQVAAQPSITTLAGLTSMGNTNNLVMNYSDIQWYNAVNDGSPQFSIGSGVNERLIIQPFYDSGAQTIDFVKFNTITASSTANKGQYTFQVDGTSQLNINDSGLNLYTDKALTINGENIISDSSGTATLSNIDALDATTEATIESAIDTLPNLSSVTSSSVTFESDTVTFTSANADDPNVVIKNTTNDNQAARLTFMKDRGTGMSDGDRIAEIDFFGEDASQNSEQYAKIMIQTLESDHGSETGTMKLQVAEYDGTLGNGLYLAGGTADGVIDATIGLGAASTTTVAGDLSITTGLLLDSVDVTTIQTGSESHADNDTSLMTSAAILDLAQSTTFLTPYHFIGYTIGDGSNYEHPQSLTDNQSPFEHATTSSGDGLTIPASSGTNQSELMRFGGKLMATAGTLKKWIGIATNTNNNDLTLGLFKWTPGDNSAGNKTPVLLDEVVIEGKGNDLTRTFSTTSFDQASVAAGDIIFTQMKTESSGNVGYFNSTLEVLH